MMAIDKRTARAWVERFQQKQSRYVNMRPENQMVDLADLACDMVFGFFNCLAEQAADQTTRAQMFEAAANGILHAVTQELLFTVPPSLERVPVKEVN